MNLKEKVQKDIKEARKNKQTVVLEALRLFFAAIKNKEIEKKEELDNKVLISLLKKQIKIYEETSSQFVDAGRKEEAEKELTKLELLKEYLPTSLSREEVARIVSQVIVGKKMKGIEDQGLVIQEVQKRIQGNADNVLVVQVVREQLQQL